MKRNRLTVAFVGVFPSILKEIPKFDNEFCNNIFENPSETTSGIFLEGFAIRVNDRPFPSIIINSQKISFIAENVDLLKRYISKIKRKLEEMNINLTFNAFGLNYDYEWLGLPKNSNIWLWDKYINQNIIIDSQYKVCNKLNIRLGINTNESVTFDIEPRKVTSNGVFISINHHFNQYLTTLPDDSYLKSLYDGSIELM
jgi:hypothetical protein